MTSHDVYILVEIDVQANRKIKLIELQIIDIITKIDTDCVWQMAECRKL
jgi:hypothetical protein